MITGSSFSAINPNRIHTQNPTGIAGDTLYVTEYFDGLGRPVQSQLRDGSYDIVSAMDYDAAGREWRMWKAYRAQTGHSYEQDFAAGAQAAYGNDPFLEQLYEDSPLNRISEMIPEGGADSSGTVSTGYEVRTWDTHNWLVTTTTDEEGNVAENWSDGWGRTVRTVAAPGTPDEAETRFEYDELDNLTKVTAPRGTVTSYTYDVQGRLIERDSPDAGTVRYKYDAAGNLRFSRDANRAAAGEVVFTTWDFAGRPLVEGVATTNFSSADPDGSPSFESDTVAWRGVHAWDGMPDTNNYPWSLFSGQMGGVTVANTKGSLAARAWRFGEEDLPETVPVDGVGISNEETYTYKASGTITVENTEVDAGGSLTLQAGQTITLKPGFQAEAGSSVHASIGFFGGHGASTIAGANPWQVELFSYDDEGRLAEKWIWTGDKREWDTYLAYDYNRQGEVTRMKVEVGSERLYQHYEYNPLGQLTHVYLTEDGILPSQPVAEVGYTYNPSGAIDQIEYRGNTVITHDYDIRGRLTDINDIGSTSNAPFAAEYRYKKNSRIDQASFWNPNINTNVDLTSAHRTYTYDYSYDNLGRLTAANYKLDSSTPAAFDLAGITYDASGNILSMQRYGPANNLIDDMSYSYGLANNQLTAITDAAGQVYDWDGASGSFSYDPNGNLTAMTGNPQISNIAYDHRNLSIHTYLDGDVEQIANYNAEGQRILKEVQMPSGTTWDFYVRDGLSTLAVISNGELQFMNLFGNGIAGRAEADNGAISAGGARRYYITDLLGSVRAVVDETGDVKENRDYDPWGVPMEQRQYVSGDKALEQFSGKEMDDQTGWYHFGARDLMSVYGRWPSPDPLADKYPSVSPYVYALNNPLIFVDPDGREVRCTTREDCERAAEELNEIHDNETNITVVETTWEEGGFFKRLFGRTETVEGFKLSTEESDFDWSSGEYTPALFDVINSTEVIFDLEFVPGDQVIFPSFGEKGTAFQAGGGGLFSRSKGGRALISADGNRLGEPTGVVIMHELVGHGHPDGGYRAISVNEHYQRKLGYRLLEPRSINPLHGGYYNTKHEIRINWQRTGLYRNK